MEWFESLSTLYSKTNKWRNSAKLIANAKPISCIKLSWICVGIFLSVLKDDPLRQPYRGAG